jgi:hypothetical protein
MWKKYSKIYKQYIEQHEQQIQYIEKQLTKEYIEQHNSRTRKSGDRARFAIYTLAFALQLRTKHG